MANRMDALTPRKGSDGKTYFDKVGVAFENRNGGWSVTFTSLPLPALNDKGELECRVLLMPPRKRGDAPAPRQAAPARDSFDDDSVPF